MIEDSDKKSLLVALQRRELDEVTSTRFHRLGSEGYFCLVNWLFDADVLSALQVVNAATLAFKLRAAGDRNLLADALCALASRDSRLAVRNKAVGLLLGWRQMSKEFEFERIPGLADDVLRPAFSKAVELGLDPALRERVNDEMEL